MERFVKIGEDGERLAADASEWLAVHDTTQNLMFAVEETRRMSHEKALKHVAALDLCGFKGWRLPSVEELFLLADRSKYDPAINTAFFPKCKSEWYWTGTPYAPSYGDYAWIVGFSGGNSNWYYRSNECRVRACRPSQS